MARRRLRHSNARRARDLWRKLIAVIVRPVIAGPACMPRIRAAISRISRAYAKADRLLEDVFGIAGAVQSLDVRVQRLVDAAATSDVQPRAEELHGLTTWFAALAESIEAESEAAFYLRPHLALIIAECELIATAAGDVAG